MSVIRWEAGHWRGQRFLCSFLLCAWHCVRSGTAVMQCILFAHGMARWVSVLVFVEVACRQFFLPLVCFFFCLCSYNLPNPDFGLAEDSVLPVACFVASCDLHASWPTCLLHVCVCFFFPSLRESLRLFPSLQLSCRHVSCLTQLRMTLIVLQIDCAALRPLRQDHEHLEKTAPVPRVDNRPAAPTRERGCDEEPPPRAPASSKATQEEGDRHKVKGERTCLYVHQPSPAHALPPCGAYECIPLFFRQTRALASPPLLWSECRSCTMKKKSE